MISALRPGGWLLLEEVDFFPVHASDNSDYRDFMTALVNTVVRAWDAIASGLVRCQRWSNV